MTSQTPMSIASESLHRLAETELSLTSRLRYVALLLAALAMTVIVGALWATEPELPPRGQVAFAALVTIGLSWVVYAAWVLSHRRVLLARHRIVAGRMAVAFTAVFVAGALVAAIVSRSAAAYAAAATGLFMLAVAAALLVRAHRTVARLSERRAALERELGKPRN